MVRSSALDELRSLVLDRYVIRALPAVLKAYAHDHDGSLPSRLADLHEYLHAEHLQDLETRVVMEPDLTVEKLIERQEELRTGAWQPIRLRDPDRAARPDCSIADDLLSLAQDLRQTRK